MAKRLVILSGPACTGKGPLAAAIKEFRKEIQYVEVPVIKSRESRGGTPRPDDLPVWNNRDYWRSAKGIKKLSKNPRYIVGDCRSFPQAIDLKKIMATKSPLVFIEVYHTIGRQLINSAYLKDVKVTTVFLSPIGLAEIGALRACGLCASTVVKGMMVLKQINRAAFQGKRLDRVLLADITARAEDAVDELRSAPDFSAVLVNHDGEGTANWKRDAKGTFNGSPEGDAGRAVQSLGSILTEEKPVEVESWRHGTI